jgi:hypothetical protein
MNMKDIHGLGRQIIATPGDSVARLVLADALEEYLEDNGPLTDFSLPVERNLIRKRDAVAALRGPGWWKCTPLGCIGDRGDVSPYTATGAKRWVLIWVVRDEHVPAQINAKGEVTREGRSPETHVILTHSELMGCAAIATLQPASDGLPMVHASTEGQSLIASEETGWQWYCEICLEDLRARRWAEELKAVRIRQWSNSWVASYRPSLPPTDPVHQLHDNLDAPDYEEEERDNDE